MGAFTSDAENGLDDLAFRSSLVSTRLQKCSLSFYKEVQAVMNATNLNTVPYSDTLQINQKCLELQASGQDVYKFGFGQSPFAPPAHVIESLREHVSEAAYANTQGHPELRARVATFHQTSHTPLNADHVYIGPGSKQLIFSVMTAFKECTLFLPSPAWVSYEPQASLLNKKVVRILTSYEEKYRITPEQLDTTFSQPSSGQKIFILTYPGNPDGLSYTAEQLEAIAEVCRKHDVLVISDEIYGLLNFEGTHKSICDFYHEGTLVTTGLSKWGAMGGWRLGVMYHHASFQYDLHRVLIGIFSETFSCVTAPVQAAAIVAYSSIEEHEGYLSGQRAILQHLSDYSYNKFNAHGIKTVKGAGGFYLMPNFSDYKSGLNAVGITTDTELCQALLGKHNVALLPGSAFGMPKDAFTARYAFVDFDGDAALAEYKETFSEAYIQKHFSRIYEGVSEICAFVKGL